MLCRSEVAYMPYMAFVKLVLIEGEPWQKMTTMMTGHTYGYLGCGHLVSNWFRSAAAEVSLENRLSFVEVGRQKETRFGFIS